MRYAAPDEELTGIIPAEPASGERAYLCAYASAEERTSWLVLDDAAHAVDSRSRVRDVVAIAAMCELAEELAAGGDLDDLRAQLVGLRLTENPPGITEAEAAALELQAAIGAPPRVATAQHLDAVGEATRRLERAFGDGGSPFATALQHAAGTVAELARDVESNYKRALV